TAEPAIPRDFLREFLAGRDIECPLCGYNLRDLAGDRCPECGDQVVLRVNMAEPRQAALLAGLIGLSCGVGLNGLLLVYGVFMQIMHPIPSGELGRFFVFNGLGFIVEGAALAWWLRKWRAIRRLRPTQRAWRAVGCWMLTLANLIMFTLNVR